MKHSEVNTGILRAYLDGELDSAPYHAMPDHIKDHIEACVDCRAELKTLTEHATNVSVLLQDLPRYPASANATATAWAAFQRRRDESDSRHNLPHDQPAHSNWKLWKIWSLAGGGLAVATVAVLFTLAPVRAWAESLLALFRVEHFTVLEVDSNFANGLQNNQTMNQAITRVLSDEVTVTQRPRQPQSVADAATASRLAGFPVKLLSGQRPTALWFESGFGAQMKLDRDRLQAILNEAGRGDLKLPASVDGANIGVRIPAGIQARYGNCGDGAKGTMKAANEGNDAEKPVHPADATCITLTELPSPIVSAPKEIDPGQIAQVALQFVGMSANDAASFTETVDWTSTLVLPVVNGQSSYKRVDIHGNEGVLLRSKVPAPVSSFTLMWVDNGIVHALAGNGDDTTAINLASQLE